MAQFNHHALRGSAFTLAFMGLILAVTAILYACAFYAGMASNLFSARDINGYILIFLLPLPACVAGLTFYLGKVKGYNIISYLLLVKMLLTVLVIEFVVLILLDEGGILAGTDIIFLIYYFSVYAILSTMLAVAAAWFLSGSVPFLAGEKPFIRPEFKMKWLFPLLGLGGLVWIAGFVHYVLYAL